MEEIRNTGPLEFRLSTDLKESTKMFLIQCLTAFCNKLCNYRRSF